MKAVALTLMTTIAMTLMVASPANAEIAWQTNLRTAHAKAQAEGKLLLLHFFTDNCVWCDRLEEGAFLDPSVNSAIEEKFVAVKVHAGQSPKLAEMFKVTKFPTDVVVNIEGKTLSHGVSPQQPDRYIAMLVGAVRSAPTPAAPGSPMIAGTPAAAPPAGAPAYAVAAKPTETAAAPVGPKSPPASTAASWELPSGPNAIAAKNRLVSNSTEGLSLAMPGDVASPSPAKAVESSKPANTSVAAAKPAASKPAAAKSSSHQPELAMDGYCAVTVVDDAEWVEGSPEFGVIHLGKLYLFSSDAKKKKFLAQPVPYTPVLNEIDVVRFFEEQVIVPGKREWAMQDPFNKRMFFFADKASMLHFENTYERYVDAAIDVMDKAVKESNPGS
ncbi:thiol:disulfide interchange protein precursor [Rubripirellula lacrimiformis]|uniref:Thiol:disulfide interchange protein n=1 Tax=Rubripirellula lacrimiformis TaxID=1930273 RepID=A0A517NEI3_9BACT|nr:DUF255 domain-containing protein [Rubripirellula lacrimiformis]QDT05543.1 thiol:disulfide interchange protein precursor [Rubripirellula lacrimiformis]